LDTAVVDAHRDLLPAEGGCADLPQSEGYLWSWLATHLRGPGRREELETVLSDARWLVGKLEYVGPAGLDADLRLSERSRIRALAAVVRQNPHLLGPLDLPGSLAATFASRLPDHTGLDELCEQILAAITGPHLHGVGPTPDLPHDALLRVSDHTADSGGVQHAHQWDRTPHPDEVASPSARALAVAPDGTWLASTSFDVTVRIWDPHTGQSRHTLTGPPAG
jgi:hypothetical protein